MNILSLETSCDETAAAILHWENGVASVLANTVSSQASLHSAWGGVVPHLAAREHINNIVPVLKETFERAHKTEDDIDLIAVTQGPGLMPALLIGVSAAKTLALTWNKPLIGINHLEGHIYANFVDMHQKAEDIFPLVALIVSGGHTQLMLLENHFHYRLLGETQDDAAGEAFDKVAKMLGLPYPGGPIVAKRADAFREKKETSYSAPLFPRPMIDFDNYDFSFSGLKTSVLYFLKKHEAEINDAIFIDEVCHEFQEAVVDVLTKKSQKAIEQYQPKTFTIAGGVSANTRLRERLRTMIAHHFPAVRYSIPELQYSLDNAVMIGVAAAYRYTQMNDAEREKLKTNFLSLDPNANLPLQ